MNQKQFVEDKLLSDGFITRNECLKESISRLGAIICDMNKKGYVISGKHEIGTYKTRWGVKNDYKYTVEYVPAKKIYTKEL